ncbi:Na+/H+ antiporter subunit E [Tianweitania sp. BSSL-BM11]|uniref:Na+/H+ antiporter subunit E n=1 Tax=Tianweitania aestuarii TaxID=2814886 RepID=A0ABS5RS72_9HYPH|nr:Na+/H+ antiporter subunit E [Tianweitania aestuarii]MBS9719861.1 Na+/H+ antiporter subunit E [Tianweitania aestuarii]
MPILLAGLFTLIWLGITGSWTLPNLILGLLLSIVALMLVRFQLGTPQTVRRPVKILALVALFVVELIKSAWRVLVLVTKPRMDVKPGIIVYPLRVQSDFQIALLANLITLTPGTLTVDVTDDRSRLIIHALDAVDPDAVRADIEQGFERLILEAFG